MKKTMTKRFVAFMLVVMMLATNCISFTASAANLTITAAPAATDGSTIRSDSGAASVLTDGVKSGKYNGGAAVTTQGTDKWTDYTLSYGAATTIDTIVVYGAAPVGGGSWNVGDDASYYGVKANGASVAITSVSTDRTNEEFPVVTIKFAATKASSFVLSVRNSKYCAAIFEIEAVEVASSGDTNVSEDTSDKYLGFDMSATLNADDSSIIDVVLSIKDIKQQLDAVEFLLTFDPAIVEGVVQESEGPMDVFMTKVPMYTMVVQGMEFQMPRYEQICTYEPANKYYHLRFIDLLQYASAKPGEEYRGLINDGDLVVTIQFRIIDASAKEFTFAATNVKGTTTGELVSVPGASASVTYKAGSVVEPTSSEAPVEPTTSEAPVEPTTSEAPVEPTTSEAPVSKTPVDLGNEFYANINIPALDKTFTKVGADVRATAANGSDEQIWKFVKKNGNAYVISNLVEGGYLAVQGELSSNLANVYISINAQEYYIYEVNGKYAISPVGYDNKAIDVNGVDFNVQYWDFNEANACQQYDIVKVELDDTTSEAPVEPTTSEAPVEPTTSEAPITGDKYFGFDMSATLNAEDSSIIDVVLSIKDVKEQLHAVELLLNFDPALVEGVVQESEGPMDVFMTKVPMYTMVVQGMEFQMPRYEQICTYEPENKYYHLRFIDLLQYANAKPGEEYLGLINDGDLVITIQFRIINANAKDFTFTATDVKGTTTVGLTSVPGASASATYKAGSVVEPTTSEAPVEPTTSEVVSSTAPVEPTTSEAPVEPTTSEAPIPGDKYFGFDMSAKLNKDDSSIIDVVLSIKDVKEQLHAVELLLNFDPALVEGVVQESEGPMDVFMTKVPMYTMVVQGMEFQMSRYEQICTYEPENKYYHLRFIDLLQYAGAKPGEEYSGLINDGDLIVTVQFRILNASASEFTFTATDVKGTTTEGLNSVPGANASATYKAGAVVEPTTSEAPVEPTTSEAPVEPTTSEAPASKTPVDLGNEFYANINIPALNKTFTKVGADVKAADADGSDEQVWKFVKVDATNAYVISNLVEGGYLAVQGELSSALANVYISIDAQEYYIYEVNGKYAISPVGYDNKAIDVNGVDFNVQYWDFNEANACQQYDIVKVELDDTTSEAPVEPTTSEAPVEPTTSEAPIPADKYFGFDMSATLNAEDSSIIDVVLSIKDVKEQLHAVELLLNFDPALVEGVVQESEGPMDVFMTKVPMYTMVVQGMEFQMPRYEQICTYEPENKYYHLRFIDLLQYAGAKPGEEYSGLINDGDLVITVQFRILDASATEFAFTATDVKGTTTEGLNSVPGASASATYKAGAVEPTTSEAPVEPTTSEAPVEPTTSEVPVEPTTSEAPVEPTTSEAPIPADKYFGFDMSATLNADDSSIIDVVLSIKDVKEQLHAVELLLNFDPALVEGVVQESEGPMDVFMTKVPMYTMVVQGMEFQMPRYEQICTYEPENKYYHLRFIDLLQYASAKPGEEYPGLINDGDIVITVQFRIIDADATEFTFTATDVKGTTTVGLNGVAGASASATYKAGAVEPTTSEETTVEPTTSEAPVEPTTSEAPVEPTTSEDVSTPDATDNYAKDKNYTVSGSFLSGKADDGVILTDGIIPELETAGATVAFSGTGATSTIIVDLAKVYTDINKIVVGGVVIAGNRQYGSVVIEISTDGVNYTALAGYTETAEDYAGTMKNYVYDLASDVAAQYIKISITSADYVLTVGDIQVFGSGNVSDETTVEPTTSEAPVEPTTSEAPVEPTTSEAPIPADKYFGFDMSATLNADDSSIIDVVLSIKDVKEQLHAVELLLNFDPALVEGVVQESEGPMDVFMTKVPMYTMVVQGMEFQMPRYEQICTYEPENKYYHLRFIDLLQYAGAKPGEEYPGLINDGDLVITVQFRILDASATEFTFTATDVKGTTTEGLNSVPGASASATYKAGAVEPTTSEAPVEPTTSEAPVEPTTSEAPVEPTTSEAPVEPTTSEAPVEPTTSEAPVEPTTSEAPVEPTTSEAPVEPTTSEAPVEPTTSEDVSTPDATDNYAKDKNYTVSGSFLSGKADDGVILTDGIIPELETAGSIVSFSGTGATNTIIVDLAKVYTDINKIVVGGVLINGNRQYGSVVIEISTDGVNYTALAGYTETAEDYAGAMKNYVYDLASDVAAQYIKISITSADYVLTVGDIQVFGSGNVSDETTVEPTTSEAPVEPTTSEAPVEPTTSEAPIPADKYFGFDMSATLNAEDSSIIDVVLSIKDVKEQLHAVELLLNFDPALVEGVVQESEGPMDVFMTKVPMYTMVVQGMEFQMPRYEQICTYEPENKYYHLRFIDLLQYAGAKPGEEYPGLINDGDIVITVQFRIIDADATEFTFTATDVKGTTTVGLNGVKGAEASATYTVKADDVTSEETTVDPVTSEDVTTVDPVTSEDVTTVDPVTSEDVTSEDVTSEDVSEGRTPVDLGDEFLANINVPALDKTFTKDGANIITATANGTDAQIWKFVKVDATNAYTIANLVDGGYMAVQGELSAALANVYISVDAQNYYIYEVNGKYVISPVGYDNKAIDVNGVDFNVQYWDFNEANACQQYDIVKVVIEDDSSEDATSEIVSDETTEDVTSEDVTSEDVTSEDVTSEDVTSEDTTSEDVTSEDTTSEVPADKYFGFDMSATVNAEDSSIIDVVLSIKDIKEQLHAVEFLLNFDPALVEGVVQESEGPMDVFMTKVPMYTMQVGGMEFQMPRYEQICTYEPENKYYHLRFIDLLQYAGAKPGEEYPGLINDGDLVITVQFRIIDADATEFTFTATDVKGTTTVGLNGVKGAEASATYTVKADDVTSEETTVDPVTSEDVTTVDPVTSEDVTSEAPVEPTTSEDVSTPDATDNYAKDMNYTVSGSFLNGKADDGVILTDGIIPELETAGATVAFSGTGATNTIIVDLAKVYTDINKIVVGGVLINGNRQYGSVVIEISTDGVNYTALAGYTETAEDYAGAMKNYVYDLASDVAAQYIKISITSADYVLTVGDIQVFGSGNVADDSSEDVTSEDVTSEDATSEDVTSEDATSEDVTSEDATSEDVTSEDVTSEDVTSEDVTSEDVTSEDATSEDVTSEDVTSEDATSEDVTSEDVTSEDVTSEDVTSEDVTSEDATSEDVTSEDVTSEDVTSEDVTSEDVTSEDATSEDVTSEDVTSEDVTSEDATSEDVTSEDVTSEDVTSEDVTSEDVTSEDVTSEDATSEDVTSEDVTSEDVTSEDATSEDETSDDATSDDVTSDDVTSEDPTSEDETSDDATSDDATSDESSETPVKPGDAGIVMFAVLAVLALAAIIVCKKARRA